MATATAPKVLSIEELTALDEVLTDEERQVRDTIRRFLA